MNTVTKIVILAVVLITLILAGITVSRRHLLRKEKTAAEASSPGHGLSIDVAALRRQTIVVAAHVTGEVNSPAVVDVVPKVSGKLESIGRADGSPLKEGDTVAAGERIALIEHGQLDSMLAQAEAACQVAAAGMSQAEVNEANMKRERDRLVALLNDGSATGQQRDQAVAAHESAVAGLRLAKSHVEQSGAARKLAELNRDDATITAPISGTITVKHVDEGNMVGPGRPLLRIVRTDVMKVAGELSELHMPSLVPGKTPAEISVDACPGMVFTGIVALVRPDVSRMTRTVRTEVSVPNPERLMKPGMFARMRILLQRREDVIAVPDSALITRSGMAYVYRIEDGTARLTAVTLGATDGSMHEVLTGLQPGDVVAIRGKELLADGSKVSVPAEQPR